MLSIALECYPAFLSYKTRSHFINRFCTFWKGRATFFAWPDEKNSPTNNGQFWSL
jgi:hypothetical protein